MLERTITKVFNDLVAAFVKSYEGNKRIAELLFDVKFRRCSIADRDHWKEDRVYMHCGCEELVICVSSSIDLLGVESLHGLFAHEIGHILHHDLAEVLEGVMTDEEIAAMNGLEDDELIADYIIERLFGFHIYYDNRKVQWLRLEE